MFEIEVELSFSSAHYLREYEGRCESLHGHNWKVKATVSGEKLNRIGVLIDFKELRQKLKEVLKELDHKNLNELPYFKKNNPTSENIACFIFEELNKKINKDLQLKKITVWETDSSSASYFRE